MDYNELAEELADEYYWINDYFNQEEQFYFEEDYGPVA